MDRQNVHIPSSSESFRISIIITLVILTIAIFLIDFFLPLGVAGGVPYVAVVLLSLKLKGIRAIWASAVACTLLIIAGYFLSPQGGVLWMVITNRFLALLAVWVVAVLSVERKWVELELRKLSQVIEQSPSAVVITDTSGAIEYVNPQFTKVTGYSTEEVLGTNPRILKSGKNPDELYKELWETITAGQVWHGEILNKNKAGELFWDLAVISPIFNAKGQITNFVAIRQNITERKKVEHQLIESEAKYLDLFDNAPDMYVSVDAKTGNIIDCNQTLSNELGYSKADLLAKHIFSVYPASHQDACKRVFKKFQSTGVVQDEELQLQRKDGSTFDVSLNVTAAKDEQGNILHSRSIWRDITDRKQAEEQLRQSQLAAAELETIKKTTATYAHEINNPLTGIKGMIQLLRETHRADDETCQMLSETLAAANQIRDVVTKLQAIKDVQYKPYAGKQEIIDVKKSQSDQTSM